MSPGDRCEQVIRLIDEVLDHLPAGREAAHDEVAGDAAADVEEIPGHWGVYYLRPTA